MPNDKLDLEAKLEELEQETPEEVVKDALKAVAGGKDAEGGPTCECNCDGLGYSYQGEKMI